MKFKVFDRSKKEFVDPRGYYIDSDGYLWQQTEEGDWYPGTTRFIPIFSTGRKDKNGKEVYEGDIINFLESGTHLVFINKKSNAVETKQINGESEFLNPLYLWNLLSCEIIGSKYTNPELLKP